MLFFLLYIRERLCFLKMASRDYDSDDNGIFITQSVHLDYNMDDLTNDVLGLEKDTLYQVETESVSSVDDGEKGKMTEVTASDEELVATCEAVETTRFKPPISDSEINSLQSKRSVFLVIKPYSSPFHHANKPMQNCALLKRCSHSFRFV